MDKDLENLIETGESCLRCGWKLTDVLWCTDNHNITVGRLLSLKKYREAALPSDKAKPVKPKPMFKNGACGKLVLD